MIALRVLNAVRVNITVAGGYSGAMVPNLQAVEEMLTAPAAEVERSLIAHPEFNVHAGEESMLRDAWAYEAEGPR